MTFDDAVRVRVIRAVAGMDSRSFAARMGVCPGTLTSWEKGRSSPQGTKKRNLEEFCREYGIGFTPTGFPFPVADCMVFKEREDAQ